MEPWAFWLVVAVLVGLWLIFAAFTGAVAILGFASEQGFIGVTVYILLWVFLFPVMLIISIIVGIVAMFSD